jgi:hypothetical protein
VSLDSNKKINKDISRNMLKSAKTLIRRTTEAYLNRKFASKSMQMLFIIGHMRSGSSLLVHILNTNPEIAGYGETHRLYRDKSDFGKVGLEIYRAFKTLPKKEKYILDKVLHSYLIKDENILKDAKIIFLLRCPSESMPSILDIKTEYNPEQTSEYYHDRIERIRLTARTIDPEKWMYATYNDLIISENKIFGQIENFLGLNSELSQEYDTIWSTGVTGIGDPSKMIEEGKIINKKKPKKIPQTLKPYLGKAQKKYSECLEELEKITTQG